jgi:hypothetical protein
MRFYPNADWATKIIRMSLAQYAIEGRNGAVGS